MESDRRARRHERAREFGRRHPRPVFVLTCAFVAGIIAICTAQLWHGTYLGLSWEIAAVAGMATAAVLGVAVWISRRDGEGRAAVRFQQAWLVLGLVSVSAIRFPFPAGPYGSVQAFFNVVHAALLGSAMVTSAAIEVWLARRLPRLRGLARRPAWQPPPAPAAGSARAGHERGELPARLRFANAEPATWRAGRLIAANGTVKWRSLKGDVEVDLTSACQALSMLPTDTRKRQPRVTTLATSSGLAEVDVSPRALEALAAGMTRQPQS